MSAGVYEDDLLLAYMPEDAAWAQRLASELTPLGIRVVIDPDRPGHEVWAHEGRSLVTAQHLLVLWSARADQSEWIRRAIEIFSTPGTGLEQPSIASAPARRILMIHLGAESRELHSFATIDELRDPSIYGAGVEAVPRHVWSAIIDQVLRVLRPDAVEAGPDAAAPILASGAQEPAADVREQVATKTDDPALADELERRPFARVIAQRMDEIWTSRRSTAGREFDGAFMVHIHGPWGSGKTSVLNFLGARLQDEERADADRWVVVHFNAWRHQHLRPPWWILINAIYRHSARQLDLRRCLLLRVRWLMWRIRADWLPVVSAVLLMATAVLLATGVLGFVPAAADGAGGESQDVAKAVDLGLTIVTAIFAAGAAVIAFSRSLVFGSARAAQVYADLRSDPLRPVVRLFERLVSAIRRPVAVFIDDLDRCDGKYVIELLEGIQTLFRDAPVTYVIAADRQWICSSFEQGYGDFTQTIGEPGRPLGHLFLEKVFQISAPLPRLSPSTRQAYWTALLTGEDGDPRARVERRRAAERTASTAVRDLHTQEELMARIAEARHDPMLEQAMRAAAAEQITSAKALRVAEHRLQRFEEHLEPNPRFMKRLVNAYGLNQAIHLLDVDGRGVPFDVLARWTILELRWPLLPDVLRTHPRSIASLVRGEPPDDPGIPAALARLFSRDEVKGVVAGGSGHALPLTENTIRRLLGLAPAAGAASSQDAASALGPS